MRTADADCRLQMQNAANRDGRKQGSFQGCSGGLQQEPRFRPVVSSPRFRCCEVGECGEVGARRWDFGRQGSALAKRKVSKYLDLR